MSHTKKLYNEMSELENMTDYTISSDSYFIVNIEGTLMSPEDIIKDELYTPNSIYAHRSGLSLIYSCVEEDKQHPLNGSLTELVGYFTREYGNVKVRIVELDTRIKVLTYLSWKIQDVYHRKMMMICPRITETKARTLTNVELCRILNEESIQWDEIADDDKYGTLYSPWIDGQKLKFTKVSEFIDVRERKKYLSLIFPE